MRNALWDGLSLVDRSGFIIIGAIVALLAAGIVFTWVLRARYASIAHDLRSHAQSGTFDAPVLRHIVHEARQAQQRNPHEINSQVIVEQAFQTELRMLLVGERFLKSCTGLLVILGLVGTFYGLTLSIGKLAALVGSKAQDASTITESLTAGLTQALSGMSVAFSTSLFGIVAAIVMTLLSVFWNVMDRRTELMGQIEAYLDNTLLAVARTASPSAVPASHLPARAPGAMPSDAGIEALGQTVARLEGVVGQFESALQTFATTTRDFREFNLHLKDNVQRLSLSFADLSETLQEHARALKDRN